MPIGCQLYLVVDKLSTLKTDVIYKYKKIIDNEEEELSLDGKVKNLEAKQKFSKTLRGNLTRLEHLVNSKKEEIRKEKELREYNIRLTEAQMGKLKPKSVELPINKDVEDAMQEGTKKRKMSGI